MNIIEKTHKIASKIYSKHRKDSLWGFTLLLICLALYAPSLYLIPAGDDLRLLSAASEVNSPLVFFTGSWGMGAEHPYFRPLHSSLLWLGYRLFGITAFPNQLASILLHALNAFLVFRILSQYQRDKKSAFLFSCFFAVSIYTSATATWVSARTGLFVGVFLLLLLHHLKPGMEERPPVNLWYAGLLITAALMSKESGLILPALAFFASIDFRDMRRSNFRLMILSAGLTTLYLLYRYWIFGVIAVDTVYETRPIMLLGGQDLNEMPAELTYKIVGFGETVVKNILALAFPIFSNQGLITRPAELAARLFLWTLIPLLVYFAAKGKLTRFQWYGLGIVALNGFIHFPYFAFFLLYLGQIGLIIFIGASELSADKKRAQQIFLSLILLLSVLLVSKGLNSALTLNQKETVGYRESAPAGINPALVADIIRRYNLP